MKRFVVFLIIVFSVSACSMKARLANDLREYQQSLKNIDASFIKKYDSLLLTTINFDLDETADFICKKYNSDKALASLLSNNLISHYPKCFTKTDEATGNVLIIEVSRPETGKPGVWGSSLETTISYLINKMESPILSTSVAYTIEPVGTKDFVVGHITNVLIRAYMPRKGNPEYETWRQNYEKFCGDTKFQCE